MENIGILLKALEFAAYRHRYQFRKGEDRPPYINHPIQVAGHLANVGGENDIVLLCAAILHDVIEDTCSSDAEKEELSATIRKMFGNEIFSVVMEVTDDKSLGKEDRKRLQIAAANLKTDNAKKLIIADKTLNVRDIALHPPVGWDYDRITSYFDWAESVVSQLRGVSSSLEKAFNDALEVARSKFPAVG